MMVRSKQSRPTFINVLLVLLILSAGKLAGALVYPDQSETFMLLHAYSADWFFYGTAFLALAFGLMSIGLIFVKHKLGYLTSIGFLLFDYLATLVALLIGLASPARFADVLAKASPGRPAELYETLSSFPAVGLLLVGGSFLYLLVYSHLKRNKKYFNVGSDGNVNWKGVAFGVQTIGSGLIIFWSVLYVLTFFSRVS